MDQQIIEGTWEEIVGRPELRGRRVRVIVMEEPTPPEDRTEWVKRLRAWAESHTPVNHHVDDSRESIY